MLLELPRILSQFQSMTALRPLIGYVSWLYVAEMSLNHLIGNFQRRISGHRSAESFLGGY